MSIPQLVQLLPYFQNLLSTMYYTQHGILNSYTGISVRSADFHLSSSILLHGSHV